MNRRDFVTKTALATLAGTGISSFGIPAPRQSKTIRIGLIGLDTSHAPAFTKIFNADENQFSDLQVVAAYPQGSTTIESSFSRIPKYTEEVKGYGVEIVDSIKSLLGRVDVVLLETNDGKPHKAQAMEVIHAGKPLFVDKPIAASLTDAMEIYKKANERNVPIFSSSSLRYMKSAQQVRYDNMVGKVLAADTFSPATLEPSHPDLFWYGIHGVEILYTVMGQGCESVTRYSKENMEVVVGIWKDGRIGTFRGMREGKHEYGGTVFGSEKNLTLGQYEGYEALVAKIAEFFRTGKSPVDDAETIEIYAFMEAADESKRRGGTKVSLAEVMKNSKK